MMLGVAALGVMAIGCGVMAGVYFTFSTFVMRSLAAIPNAQGITAMQSINRVILSSAFMPLFAATSVASLALAVWGFARLGSPGAAPMIAGGLVYFAGMFVCTAAFNVPLNNALDAVDATTPGAARVWTDYLSAWTRWNHLRTLSCAAASALFVAAAWTFH